MPNYRHGARPTVGVLAGWQVYEGNVNGFLDLALRGIYSAAQEQGCNLLFACGVGHAIGPHRLCPAWPVGSSDSDFVPVGPWNTDGLIVINPLLNEERSRYIQQIRKEGYPVVFVNPGEQGIAIVPDNASGVYQAVAHLAQHGHRRIAFIAGYKGEVDKDSLERLMIYKAAVQEYGLENDPSLIEYGSHSIEDGYQAMNRLLESGAPFRAILVSDDHSAFGAMSAIREAHLRIPEDIAIVGFDNLPEAAGQEPPLTTVSYPIGDAGKKALALLLEIINGPLTTEEEVVRIPVHLIVRESCGCQPGSAITSIPAKIGDQASVIANIAKSLSAIVSVETSRMDLSEINALCSRLVEAFRRNLEDRSQVVFQSAFQEVLHRLEDAGDDPTVWHSALALLEQNEFFLGETPDHSSRAQTEAMLNQARMAISISLRKQKAQYIITRGYVADQIGLLTARLFTAVDDRQIFDMLREFLPKVGIGRADIGFYEAGKEDPAAWTRLYPVANLDLVPAGFSSRQFPPNDLYPAGMPFRLTLFPLVQQGQVEGFIAFDSLDLATCVTIVRHLTAAFRSVRLYRAAAEGRHLAEEANQLKSRFLASVSHELRTPLNLIVGLSEMLLAGRRDTYTPPLPEAYRRDLTQIHSSAQHLGWLIRDVLDLASSQAGQLRLTNGPVDTTQLLAVVAAAGEQLAHEKGLAWEADLPADLPTLWGDQTRLTQVGLNLVSNAVKFTEEGTVSLMAKVEDGSLLVEVSDTGLGIPVEEQQLIFNEFRQSERTSQRGYGGLGLGLAICKRLVELHGGEIGVRSKGEVNSGSTFYLRLPILEAGSHRDGQQRLAIVAVEGLEQGERLRAHLEREGYVVEVCMADTAGEWLANVIARPPQAVVLEAGVAARQGWDVLKVLKSNPATQATSVLFYALRGDSGSMLTLDYLSKPLSSQALMDALELQELSGADEKGKTILVVDDEPGILEMHVRMVNGLGAGYRVLEARNGREALRLIREERPDLVLLDLMMPELDGFGVLEAMRAGETTRDIPVIVLTAQVLTESDMACLNRGVTAVLQKDIFSAAETLGHIESALERLPRLNSEMQKVVRKAMAYIQEHYAEAYTRRELALHTGVSERYLTRCFHQELGITPAKYNDRYRMKQARAMLESGKSVTETALEVGFSSVSSFTRFFHKEMGISPNAYRKEPAKK